MILITETPNGEAWNVLPAAFIALNNNHDPSSHVDNSERGHWWGLTPTRWSNEGPLPARFKPLACTPLCWMPMPEAEPVSKLRRRAGQIYRSHVVKP